MIKMNGIFTLGLLARDSNKLESLTLTLEGTLMPLLMTSITDFNKVNEGNQLDIDFEISYENIVIEKGNYHVKLTGAGEKYNHISLIRKSEQGDNVVFSLYAETELNTETEVKVKFALPKTDISQNANNVH